MLFLLTKSGSCKKSTHTNKKWQQDSPEKDPQLCYPEYKRGWTSAGCWPLFSLPQTSPHHIIPKFPNLSPPPSSLSLSLPKSTSPLPQIPETYALLTPKIHSLFQNLLHHFIKFLLDLSIPNPKFYSPSLPIYDNITSPQHKIPQLWKHIRTYNLISVCLFSYRSLFKEPIIIIIIITSSGMLNSSPNPDNAIVKELRQSEWKIPPLLRVVLYRMLLLRNGFWEFASQRRQSFEARAPQSLPDTPWRTRSKVPNSVGNPLDASR